jgi:hypothetical protein
MDQSKHG